MLSLALVLSACSLTGLHDARQQFYAGQYEKAAEVLAEHEGPSRNRFLYLVEKGTILNRLGRYEESNRQFLQASRLIEEQDVISVSQQAGSMVTNEWVTEYKGEYSERLWVHTYLMMNFLLLGEADEALVEAKQALKIFGRHENTLAKDLFTRALVALCFDNVREYNDAYIEYKKIAGLLPNPTPVAADLYRLGHWLSMADEANRYERYLTPGRAAGLLKHQDGELVLFVAAGRAPAKMPGNIVLPPTIRFSFPRYERQAESNIRLTFPDQPGGKTIEIATDIGLVARAALEDRAKTVIAKETARVVAKEALARAVEKNSNELAGALVRGFFFLTEEADIRCWQTLPAGFLLVRLPLAAGQYKLRFSVYEGGLLLDTVVLPEFSLKSGQRYFYSVRR